MDSKVFLHKKPFLNLCLIKDIGNHEPCFEGRLSQLHSEPCQTYKMGGFTTIFNG